MTGNPEITYYKFKDVKYWIRFAFSLKYNLPDFRLDLYTCDFPLLSGNKFQGKVLDLYPWVKHLGPGNWSSPHLIYFRNSRFFNVATKLSTMKFLCVLNPNSALPINCMWRCALNVVYRAFYAISFYKSWKINMYALETTSLVFECLLAHRQLWQSCV